MGTGDHTTVQRKCRPGRWPITIRPYPWTVRMRRSSWTGAIYSSKKGMITLPIPTMWDRWSLKRGILICTAISALFMPGEIRWIRLYWTWTCHCSTWSGRGYTVEHIHGGTVRRNTSDRPWWSIRFRNTGTCSFRHWTSDWEAWERFKGRNQGADSTAGTGYFIWPDFRSSKL